VWARRLGRPAAAGVVGSLLVVPMASPSGFPRHTEAHVVRSVTLTVTVSGQGTVETVAPGPSGITCPGTCHHSFAKGTTVTLFGQSVKRGWLFNGWSGPCASAGLSVCSLKLTRSQTIHAKFVNEGGG